VQNNLTGWTGRFDFGFGIWDFGLRIADCGLGKDFKRRGRGVRREEKDEPFSALSAFSALKTILFILSILFESSPATTQI